MGVQGCFPVSEKGLSVISQQIEIINKLGLHARAAAKFVTLASGFSSHIEIAHGSRKVNGKSIMGVMMLAASKGKVVEISVHGEDEQHALAQLIELISQRFGEAE